MNESHLADLTKATANLADRVAALEALVMGRDLAHQQCIQALLLAVDSAKNPIVSGLLGQLAADARQELPAPAERYFDVAIEAAQHALRTAR